MKGLWTFLLLLVLSFTFGCASTQPHLAPPVVKSPAEVIKGMDASTVALVLRHNDDVFVYCTAVWVSEKTILTASHCVEGAATQWAKDHSRKSNKTDGDDDDDEDSIQLPKMVGFKMYYVVQGEVEGVGKEPSATHLATVAMFDKKHDLALLKVDGKVIPFHGIAKLADEAPAAGEHVYILGHVKGLYWSHIEGVVSAARDDVTNSLGFHGPFLQISGPVYYGNSGGGAFNTKGELVGIASFMFRAPQTTMFIHLDSIKTFLKVN